MLGRVLTAPREERWNRFKNVEVSAEECCAASRPDCGRLAQEDAMRSESGRLAHEEDANRPESGRLPKEDAKRPESARLPQEEDAKRPDIIRDA